MTLAKTIHRDARTSLFESLYSAHSGDVLRYAVRRGLSRLDAEEVVVETFLVCWRRLNDVPDPALPWLLAVARRVLANQRRTQRRRLALDTKMADGHPGVEPSSSDGPAEGVTDLEGLGDALARLRDGDREVLELVVWQGLTHETAASVLGCTRNAVTKRFRRACRELEAQLSSSRT